MRKKSDQADVLGVGATLMSSAPTGQISERLDVGRHRKGQQILAMGVFVMMTFGITVLTVTPAGACQPL